MKFSKSVLSMSNKDGALLFNCNGVYLEDSLGQQVPGSWHLNPGWHTEDRIANGNTYNGNNFHYTMIGFPPFYSDDSTYQIYHLNVDIVDGELLSEKLFRTSVQHRSNGSLVVTELNKIIRSDYHSRYTNACRHSNGRDWWLAIPNRRSNCYFIDLVTPNTFQELNPQCLGPIRNEYEDQGDGVFSPNGQHYATMANFNDLFLFDFDRTLGSLSNPRHFLINDSADSISVRTGLAFSPNSRFMYVANTYNLYQYDLWEDDIESSRLLIAENWPNFPENPSISDAQLGPDGKIYFIAPNNSVTFLHIMHDPNKKGSDCNFEYEGLDLGHINSSTIPQFPNYRLGPLDGSIADTLGIDNVPVADFRWQDLGQLTVDFRNLSHHEPKDHYWDFGDGNTSTTYRPEHTYADTGTYHVCLTVSNGYGEDTFCRDVSLTGTSVSTEPEIIKNELVQIYPNPARDYVILKFSEIGMYSIRMYDMLGNLVLERKTEALNYQMWVSKLPAGVYSIQIRNEKNEVVVEKIVVQ
jgi:hypothetical protein